MTAYYMEDNLIFLFYFIFFISFVDERKINRIKVSD